MEGQLSELAEAVKALEARLAVLGHPAAPAAVTEAIRREQEDVTPETLVVIAAAVTAFLGKKVRIRSARLVRHQAVGASAWAQQGRATVHGSHTLRRKG